MYFVVLTNVRLEHVPQRFMSEIEMFVENFCIECFVSDVFISCGVVVILYDTGWSGTQDHPLASSS